MRRCRVTLKFCGCCNPYVNLSRIVSHLRAAVEHYNGFEIVPVASGDADILIIFCGCPRACADRAENRTGRLATVLVAGESVDGEPVSEIDLAVVVGQKLAGTLNQWKRRCSRCS